MLEINKVYNEDCIGQNGMCLIEDKSVDMILCDLPYGNGKTACSWDVIIPFDKLWEQYTRIIKPLGAIVLFASQPFTTDLISSNRKWFKYCWVWNKQKAGNFATAKYNPLRVTEDIVVFGNGKIKYNPQMEKALEENKRPRGKAYKQTKDTLSDFSGGEFKTSEYHNEDLRYPQNIINIKSTEKECNQIHRVHPTQKPIALCEYLVKTYTNENDLVLDNCMGSFTTAVSCINTNRNFIGFELDEEYYKLGQKRLEDLDTV